MKNNRLFSIILALLVCLSMVVSASAANESDFALTLESKDSSVEVIDAAVVGAGQTFKVTVSIEKNPGVKAAIGYVSFDSAKLELVEAKSLVSNVTVPESKVDGRVTVVIGDVQATFTPDKYEAVNATGAVAELTFKVLEKSDVQTSVALEVVKGNVVDANGKFNTLTVSGDELNVNVVGENHTCDKNNTTDANNKVDPTCTEAGKESDKLCSHCGKVVTEGAAIAATGHNWGEGEITTAPTCAEMGVRTYTCANCGETKTDDHVPATGEHTYGDWTVTKEATVDAEGEETRTCSVCGQKETRSIEKLEPVKSNKTVVIVVIVVVGVLAGAGVAAYFVLKNKKK